MGNKNRNFWQTLPKPFFALAPLANVTDAAFRRLIAIYGKPDVMWTEFVSADGLMLGNKDVLLRDLLFTDAERPIVAQFFTAKPKMMEKAAALAKELGFDGVDINMGCPDKSIEKQGAGAKLMLNPGLAAEILEAAKQGAAGLPVSVKTRLGYNVDILDEWVPALLRAKPAALTIHARTRKEMSLVPARWERVKRTVEIRNELESETLIMGNGDIKDLVDARKKVQESGADGAMLGRAIFGNPWLFAMAKNVSEKSSGLPAGRGQTFPHHILPPSEFRLGVAIEHAKLFEDLLGDIKSFSIMKKHFKAYAEGFPGAKELRIRLMETESASDVRVIIEQFLELGYTVPV